jgi:protocatechuate 3,4-dioxygenase, beta subunit
MLVRTTIPRRSLLAGLGVGASLLWPRGTYAEVLAETARTTEGPFYPDQLPLDTDNDLLLLNDALTPSTGRITYFSGRILSPTGAPVCNATIEIWQCDAKGSYLHSKGRVGERDPNFQGYGRVLTGSTGEYGFRTIRPVSYSQYGITRAPHIHLAVSRNGKRVLTTQVHVAGDPLNGDDTVLTGLDAAARATVIADFRPVPGSPLGEVAARWDVVLGQTALEGDDGAMRGAIGKPEGAPAFWDYVKAWEAKQRKP